MAAGRKLHRRVPLPWAVLWGVFPDLFAFTPAFLLAAWLRLVQGQDLGGRFFFLNSAAREALPAFLRPDQLYHFSHSLVIFSLVFGAVWLLRRRPALVMLCWPLHILMDIPTHRAGRYGTPFLWPISSYVFDGISWGQRWFMILNWSSIAIAYLALLVWYFVSRRNGNYHGPVRGMPADQQPASSTAVERQLQ